MKSENFKRLDSIKAAHQSERTKSSTRMEDYLEIISELVELKGYATTLTQAAIDWLKEKNCNMIRLIASPQSQNIYENMGFRGTDEMVLWMY